MNSFHNVDNKPYYSKELPLDSTPPWEKRRPSLRFTDKNIPKEKDQESVLKKYALKSQLKKRRESISTTQDRPVSVNVIPRLTKSSILQQTHTKEEYSKQQWDPHIDAFDILRAKLNGITRSMQELHVQELFYDELLMEKRKRRDNVMTPGLHRLSLTVEAENLNECHRRSVSFGYSELNHKEKEEIEEETKTVSSPSLTTLFVTTNSLIHSKLDELSETASIHSEHENESGSEWRKQFLNLVTLCIYQSEALESLSVDIIHVEQRVRELMFLNQSIDEQFYEREKQYGERIRECQDVAKQQLLMIDSLEELTADINMKLDSNVQQMTDQERQEEEEEEVVERWDFSRAISDLLNMEDKLDIVHKMRWDVGNFVGEDVGTGHIIHSFEDQLNSIDLMIAGSGATNSSLDQADQEESNFISPSIRHIKFHQRQYVLHLSLRDKQTRFVLLPKTSWVPDEQTNLCQFPSCSTQFSLFKRRHHCRRCGQIICQKHSANRLPLFSSTNQFQWSRVCDACFQDLIVMQTK